MLLINYWWFPWTNLEAILWILLFTVDALRWRGRRQFAAVAVIFMAMVFTKETAVFLPVWIVLRALTEPESSWRRAAPICAMGFNAAALFTGRLPWPLFDNSHWTDWPVGLTDFIAILAMSILGALWSQRGREPVILALSLLSLSYLFVCVVMINMPESDKLLPTLTFGIYAYARWCAFESRPCTESGRTRAGITG